MSIYYDFYRQSGIFKGKDKVIARIVDNGTTETDDIIKKIEEASTLSSADMKAAIHALASAIASELQDGRNVHIDGLGYFSLTIDATVEKREEEQFYAKKMAVKRVKFRAEKSFEQQFLDAKFVAKSHRCQTQDLMNLERAKQIAEQLLAEKPTFTVNEFAKAAQIRVQQTYRWTQQLEDDGAVKNVGTTRHKIFMKA